MQAHPRLHTKTLSSTDNNFQRKSQSYLLKLLFHFASSIQKGNLVDWCFAGTWGDIVWIVAIPIDMRWPYIVLICNSSMTLSREHLLPSAHAPWHLFSLSTVLIGPLLFSLFRLRSPCIF